MSPTAVEISVFLYYLLSLYNICEERARVNEISEQPELMAVFAL